MLPVGGAERHIFGAVSRGARLFRSRARVTVKGRADVPATWASLR